MIRRISLPSGLVAGLVALAGSSTIAQTTPLPPAINDPPRPASPGRDPSIPLTTPTTAPAPSEAGPGVLKVEQPADVGPHGEPINLATALQLSGARPLDIAAATASVEQAVALLLQARALWIPNINGGVDYFRHDGYQQNLFTGTRFQKGRQSFFTGGGPTANYGVADALFAPLFAKKIVASREADLQAARNNSLSSVAQAFFNIQEARGRIVGADAAIARSTQLVRYAERLAPGLIAPLEVNRAKAELQSVEQSREAAVRDWRTSSAALAEILLLPPETLLEPIEPPFLPVSVVPPGCSIADLTLVAVRNRPEIASQRNQVDAAVKLVQQEKSRPFLPNLIITGPSTTNGQLAAGNLTVGPNNFLNSNGPAFNIEIGAVWQLQNAGVGNVGRIRQRQAEERLAAVQLQRNVYRARSEVSQALASVETARVRIPITEEGLRQAIVSADKNFIGLSETTRPGGELLQLVVRPQEVVAAIIQLNASYQDYSNAVNEFSRSQFALYRALGNPAQTVTGVWSGGVKGAPRRLDPPKTPVPPPNFPARP